MLAYMLATVLTLASSGSLPGACAGCDFAHMDLSGKDLSNVSYAGADFKGATLRNVDFQGAA